MSLRQNVPDQEMIVDTMYASVSKAIVRAVKMQGKVINDENMILNVNYISLYAIFRHADGLAA